MPAKQISGKEIAQQIREEPKQEVIASQHHAERAPFETLVGGSQ